MAKNHIGQGSLHTQDAQLNQNMPNVIEQIGPQPTRPYAHKRQGSKSSKDGLRKKQH